MLSKIASDEVNNKLIVLTSSQSVYKNTSTAI